MIPPVTSQAMAVLSPRQGDAPEQKAMDVAFLVTPSLAAMVEGVIVAAG